MRIDKYQRKKILEVLKRVKINVKEKGIIDRENSYLLAHIEVYLREYQKEDVNITYENFLKLEFEDGPVNRSEEAVRRYFCEKFKDFIKKFFKTEGNDWEYKLKPRKKGY